jgi:dynein heavy chain
MAGQLRSDHPNEAEDVILIRAIKDANIPKFLHDDLPLFNALVQDLFPEIAIEEIGDEMLETQIGSSCDWL